MTDTTRPSPLPTHFPEPGASDLQTGDFGLNGDLKATMLAALEATWDKDDPGATQLPADDADTISPDTPATAAPDPTSAVPPQAAADGAAGAEAGGDGAAPDLPASPAAPNPDAAEAPFDLNTFARDYFGTDLNPAQARELFGLLNGLQNLSPAQQAQVDAVLAGGAQGQYPITAPQQEYAPQPQIPGQLQIPGQPAPQPAIGQPPLGLPPRPDDSDYEGQQVYDRYIAPMATMVDQRMATIEQQVAATTAAQQLREREGNAATITQASEVWRAEHPEITDGEWARLTDNVIRSGTLMPMVAAHGDFSKATRAVLEQHFWADDQLRAKAIANISSGRAANTGLPDATSPIASDASEIERQRQARAASVAGGGGGQTPRGGDITTPTSTEGRKAAMVAALSAEGNFG